MKIRQGKIWLAVLLISGFFSCDRNSTASNDSDPALAQVVVDSPFFSLQKYFEREAERLSARSALVQKDVSINGKMESKTVRDLNWNDEFSVFMASDINKPAWIDLYKTDSTLLETHYSTQDKDLKTKSIKIKKDSLQRVKAIIISNLTQNNLYTTEEKLYYYPDSLYIIETNQAVRALGDNIYKITGRFK